MNQLSIKTLILIFPRYGLCNKLITWAKALVWCEKNSARLVVKGWFHLPFGSILRGDKSWRWYGGFFKGSKPLAAILSSRKFIHITSIDDPVIESTSTYRFGGTPYISDLPDLSDFQPLVKQEFYKMIRARHLNLANKFARPVIGMHIRRGDYNKIGSAVDLEYFVDLIHQLRETIGRDVPVTIFSDGYKSELKEILDIPNVSLFLSVNDLVDLLVLSKSQILVTSPGSSYSYWATFISEGMVIHHPSTWVPQCRPVLVNAQKFEGPIEKAGNFPKELIKQLVDLSTELK